MEAYIFYGVAIVFLVVSYFFNKDKTFIALKKAWSSFEGLLPQLLSVLLLVGLVLSILNPSIISKTIGSNSGWLGVVASALVGAITLMPPYVSFPTAAMLLQAGAGYMQVGAFVSTLMMVGVVTAPVEIKYFGKKLTFLRNIFAFAFSFLVAYVINLAVK